jgi:exonuclease III
MRDKHIGVLALQETHLSQTETDNLNNFFERNLAIFSSIDPEILNPSAKGVAIVLNKQMTNVSNVQMDVIIEGRALMLTVPWHRDLALRFLAIYSPNNPSENTTFLETLRTKIETMPNADLILGDFNMVEEALDRLPHYRDAQNVSDAMSALQEKLDLCDGWRYIYPDLPNYSFLQNLSGSQLRIDRIYVPFESLVDLSDWEIETCTLPTHHKLVSAKQMEHPIANPER